MIENNWLKELPTKLGFYWIKSLKTNRISLLRLGKNNHGDFMWEQIGFNVEMLYQFYGYDNCEFLKIDCPLDGYFYQEKAGEFYPRED